MPKKKDYNKRVDIKVGDISGIGGAVNIASGNITTSQNITGLSVAEIGTLFQTFYTKIDARPETPVAIKQDLKADVQEIEAAVTQAVSQKETLDEDSLAQHFRNIARIAPDILDVIVATLSNPLAGIGVAVQKIAEKAKGDAGNA